MQGRRSREGSRLRRLVTVQRDAFESATTLVGEPRSRVIDEYPPHQARSHAKEMGPVAPVDMPLIDQSEVGFVDEGGWLQRMAGYLAPQLRACDTSQMVVDNRDELVKRVSFAIADREEKVRDSGRVRFAIRHPGRRENRARLGSGSRGNGRDATGASNRAGSHIIRGNRAETHARRVISRP